MNIINKTRLIHLANTTYIKKETRLSPKFWAKCAAIISSMTAMEANASNATVTVDAGIITSTGLTTADTASPISLTKAGNGTLLLDNNNGDSSSGRKAFIAPINVTAGTLAVGHSGALGSRWDGSVYTAGTYAPLTMSDTTTLQAKTATTLTIANPIVLGAGSAAATISIDANSTLFQLNGVIANNGAHAGTLSLIDSSGSGTIILNAANTYTGGTTVGGNATLKIAHISAIPATGTVTLGGGTTLESIVTATLSNTIDLDGAATIDVTTESTLDASGNITGTNALTKTNMGTLELSGTGTLGVTSLTVSGGTLNISSARTASTTPITVASGARVSIAAANLPAGVGSVFTLAAGTLHADGSTTPFTLGKDIATSADASILEILGTVTTANSIGSNANTLSKTGAGTLNVSGTNKLASTGLFTVSAGTLQLSATQATSTTPITVGASGTVSIAAANLPAGVGSVFTLAAGTLHADGSTTPFTLGKDIATSADASILEILGTVTTANSIGSNANTLSKTGAGTLNVSGTNKLASTGLFTVSTGTLQLSGDQTLSTTPITVASGATVTVGGAYLPAGAGSVFTLAGTLTSTAGSNVTLAPASVTLSGSPTINVGTKNLEIDTIFSGAGALTVNGTNNTAAINATNNASRLILGGANTNSGGISVLTGGLQLKVSSVSTTSGAAGTGAITLAGGTLLEGNTASGSYANDITLTKAGSALSATFLATQNFTMTGVISDSGVLSTALGLIIDGGTNGATAGNTVTFAQTANNTYAGATTLQGGAKISISHARHLYGTSLVNMGNNTSIIVTAGGFSLPPLVL